MSSKGVKGTPITKDTILEVGQVLYGRTSESEPKAHYKIIFAVTNNKVQFISISSTYKTELKVDPRDFIGNNHINGYANNDHIESKSLDQLVKLSDENRIVVKPYTATSQLLRKIQDMLDHIAKLNNTISEQEEEISKLKEELENSKNKQDDSSSETQETIEDLEKLIQEKETDVKKLQSHSSKKQESSNKAKDIVLKILKVLFICFGVFSALCTLIYNPTMIFIFAIVLLIIYLVKNQDFRKSFIKIATTALSIMGVIIAVSFVAMPFSDYSLIMFPVLGIAGYFLFKKLQNKS